MNKMIVRIIVLMLIIEAIEEVFLNLKDIKPENLKIIIKKARKIKKIVLVEL